MCSLEREVEISACTVLQSLSRKKFKTLFWVLALLIWLILLIILIDALTINSPENPFRPHRFIIGLGFVALTGLLRIAYKKTKKQSRYLK